MVIYKQIKHAILRIKESSLLFPFLIISIYLLSRIIFIKLGIKFDISSLEYFAQYLDINILKDDLINGIYFQHSQPPLFNMFLGIILKLFPEKYELIFTIFYYFCGFTTYLLIYKILCLVKFDSWIALCIATIFILTPEAILYENWLFYTWPIATLLTLAAYELLLYEKTLQLRNGVIFLIAIMFVCLTRSMFHLVYLTVCIMLILSIHTLNRKKIGIVSIGTLLLVGLIFLKNLAIFGFFGSSSWIGMNLWKIAPHGEVSMLIANPKVTNIPVFSPISEYPEKYRKVPIRFSEISVLTAEYKMNGKQNFNHYGYISISQEYLKGSLNLISNDFSGYLNNVIKAWVKYSYPTWHYYFLGNNRKTIQGYINVISFVKYRLYIERELFGIKPVDYLPISSLLIIPTALIFIVIFFTINFIKFIRGDVCLQQIVFFSFMVLTILYIAVIGNAIEFGENHRFRVQTDSLFLPYNSHFY